MTAPDDSPPPAGAEAEAVLGHRFADPALLRQALTHTSRLGAQATVADKRKGANERMEFLGDALLGAAVCVLIYRRLPEADEGQLSRRKANLVSRRNLARAFDHAGLAPRCLVGSAMGGEWPDSVKANLIEAIYGATFLDGGWEALCAVVEASLAPFLDDPGAEETDARMRLQSWCLEHHRRLPDYRCERSGGTDHDPQFGATATIAGQSASGIGSSRRRAEAAAAAALMAQLVPAPPAGDGPPPALS